MYVAINVAQTKGRVYKSILLMESYRTAQGPRRRTLANLSRLPQDLVELIRRYCRGEQLGSLDTVQVRASWDFAGLAVVDFYWQKYRLDSVLAPVGARWLGRLKAMVWHRLFEPGSKRSLKKWAQDTALELFLKVSPAALHENALYEAMDGLLGHWAGIEKGLYRRRDKPPDLLLYDLTSSYFEGRKVKRGRYGYSRDHRSDRPQILIALVKDEQGVPLSVQLLKGNRADVGTVTRRMVGLKRRFGITQGMYVGDNGTVSAMNLEFLRAQGFDYLVCLERRAIQPLLEKAGQALQLGLFDERGWISFEHEEKRYVLCHSGPRAERDRKRREARMAKGRAQLERLQARVSAGRLKQEKKIIERATRILSSTQSSPYFRYEAGQGVFFFQEDTEKIQAEVAVDGKYLLECTRTHLDPQRIRENYQDLRLLEGAFRVIKSFLEFRPVFHWKDRRVQAHLYLVFLAYWLERQIELEWQRKDFKERVCEVLRDLNGVRLEQIQMEPLPIPIYRLSNWNEERKNMTELLALAEPIHRAIPVGKAPP